MGDGGVGRERSGRRAGKQDAGGGGVRQRPFRTLVGGVIRVITVDDRDQVGFRVGQNETGGGFDFEFVHAIPLSGAEEDRPVGVGQANLPDGFGVDLVEQDRGGGAVRFVQQLEGDR